MKLPTLRRLGLTRFHKVDFNGLSVSARGTKLRRWPGLRNLPYRTGDQIELVVIVKGNAEKAELSESVNLNFADRGNEVPFETLGRQRLGLGEQQLQFTFHRRSFSGEYDVGIAFWSFPPGDDTWRATYRTTLVATQFIVDYKPIMLALGTVLGVILAQAIPWLWRLLAS